MLLALAAVWFFFGLSWLVKIKKNVFIFPRQSRLCTCSAFVIRYLFFGLHIVIDDGEGDDED